MIIYLSSLVHSFRHLAVVSIHEVACENCDTILIYLSFYRLLHSMKCPSTEILAFNAFLSPVVAPRIDPVLQKGNYLHHIILLYNRCSLESPYHLAAVSGAHFTQGTILIVILVFSGSAKSRTHQSAVGGFLVTRRGWPGRLRACRIWTFINSV